MIYWSWFSIILSMAGLGHWVGALVISPTVLVIEGFYELLALDLQGIWGTVYLLSLINGSIVKDLSN